MSERSQPGDGAASAHEPEGLADAGRGIRQAAPDAGGDHANGCGMAVALASPRPEGE